MAVINMLPHGGSESETVLWTNSSPTTAFAAQTVTLSDSLENYDKLRIYAIRTRGTSDHVVSFEVNIAEDLDYFVSGDNKMAFSISMLGETYNYSRIGYVTTGKNGVYFTTAYRVNSTSGHNTGYCIPVKISGIK